MRLNDSRVEAVAAVSDLDRAKDFYERRVGPVPDADEEGGVRYPCAGEGALFIYLSPKNAGTSRATVAGWFVDDPDQTITELASRDVAVEHHDQPGGHAHTDVTGVADVVNEVWVDVKGDRDAGREQGCG